MNVDTIDNIPVFKTQEDAERYAKEIGCEGYHTHQHEGEIVYMPCEEHGSVLDKLQDVGQNLEDVLEDYQITQIRIVDNPDQVSQRYLKRLEKKLSKEELSAEKFYRIVSNPNEPSVLDLPYRRFRYIYAPGEGAPDLIDTSRSFCVRMMGGRQRVYRYEDILDLSAQLEVEDTNRRIIPRPRNSGPVDIWTWKGGAGCLHRFIELSLEPVGYIPDNAVIAAEQSELMMPAAGQTGQINLPPNYAGQQQQGFSYDVSALAPYTETTGDTVTQDFIDKKPYERKDDYLARCMGSERMKGEYPDEKQRYAVCISDYESFSMDSKNVILVDIDDTLISKGKPMMKTIEYIDEKSDDYRIIIVSGRPVARLEETKKELDDLGVYYDEIFLQDFAEDTSGEVGKKFKEYKAKKLIDSGMRVVEAIENDEETRNVYDELGIHAMAPESVDVNFKPVSFSEGYGVFRDKETAMEYSMFCGCGGLVEDYLFKGEKMYWGCSKKRKNLNFSLEEEKRLIYTPVMVAGKMIPRVNEMGEKYYVRFTPESIEKMAYKYLKEKRTDKVNYEHTDQKLEDVYMVESWLIQSENDKAYKWFTKEQVPIGSWMAAFKVDSEDVWENYVKANKVRGASLQGNFLYIN